MSLFSFKISQMREINALNFFKRLYEKVIYEEDLLSAAAQVAYYFAFAIFPLLIVLVSIFGFVIDAAGDLRAELYFYLKQVMPKAAADLVRNTVEEVSQNTSSGKLTVGLLIALYSASAGIDGIRVALNSVYNISDGRSWWTKKGISLGMTLILTVLVTFALGIIFYGSKFLAVVLQTLNIPVESPIFLLILQWITFGFVLISSFALLYNYLPHHKKFKWYWITPGAILGIVLWLLLSYGLRTYLSYYNTYDRTYGSLGAMIILMLWLYLTALVILIGGSLNAVLGEMADPETAEAAAEKAAALEIVKHPDAENLEEIVADKRAEVLAELEEITKDKPKKKSKKKRRK